MPIAGAAAVGIAAALATVAGTAYGIYSASNPPKTPKQATQALNAAQNQLPKLQAQLSSASASGKNTASIQKKIDATKQSISYLTQWINNYGNTIAPKTPSATGGTPLASPVNNASVQGATNWPLLIGAGAVVVGAGYVILKVAKKKKRK